MQTQSGTTEEMARAYPGVDEGLSDSELAPLLRDAERVVRSIAPPPASLPVPTEYMQDASDSELRVLAWLLAQPGYVRSESVEGVSVSYATEGGPIYDLVRMLMARWLVGSPARATISANAYSNRLTEKDMW